MKIKQVPEDFQVKEISAVPKLVKGGQYTYFILRKKNYTTTRALTTIAKAARVSRKRFNFAGTKDKRAVTEQLICAWKVPPAQLKKVKLKDLSIKVIGQGEEKVNLGYLLGNEFKIKVKDLSKKDVEKVKANLDLIKRIGFPNYFGEQRFSGGRTSAIGLEILKGYIKGAVLYFLTYPGADESEEVKKARNFAKKNIGDWSEILAQMPRSLSLEKSVLNHLVQYQNDFAGALRALHKKIRMLFVHAIQSFIFNLALSALIKKRCKKYKEFKFLDKKLAIPLEKIKLPRELPIVGFNSKLGKDVFSIEIKKLLAKDNLTLANFHCTRMPELASAGTTRKTFVKPAQIKISKPAKDELNKGKLKVTLSFGLEKSAYATVLLKALIV